jgi:hypothetical protein
MRDGLHVLDVVFEVQKLAKAEQGEHLDGCLLFADELRLGFFQPGAAAKVEDFRDERAGQPASAKFGMHQHADAADVAFPAAELLVERGCPDDFVINHAEQRQVAAHVNVPAPVADDLEVLHAVLDEHPFAFGDVQKELVEFLLVVGLQRPQHRFFSVLKFDGLGEFLQFKFNTE